jgi:hypothetical protein
MASTYSTNLAIELIGAGEQSGTWGTTTNNNLGTLLEQAICGYGTAAVTTGNTTTVTMPNGASGVARNMVINVTGTGGASTVLAVPDSKTKIYTIFNGATGAITVRTVSGSGISVPTSTKAILYCDGTNVVDAANYFSSLTLGAALPVASGGTGGTSTTAYAVYTGNSGGTGFTPVAPGASGNVLTSNGTNWASSTPASGGGVTSVAALTLGTAGTDLSSTVANGTTTPVITLQVPTASAANRGVLSAADWASFNNKGNGGRGQSFTTSGTFTIPTGITTLKVTVQGGGGNGASSAARGGSSGATAIVYLTGLTPGNTIGVTVGAVAGNSSIQSGTQTITTVTGAGNGGTATNGTININGVVGGFYSYDGTTYTGGTGGSSIFGGAGAGGNNLQLGYAATGYGSGGGGGGGYNCCGVVWKTGGSGAQGIVIFEY